MGLSPRQKAQRQQKRAQKKRAVKRISSRTKENETVLSFVEAGTQCDQDEKLLELSKSATVSQKTRDRANVIRLSARGWKVAKIASYFNVSKLVVRNTIHRWRSREISGLEDTPTPFYIAPVNEHHP